jgi:acetylornithine aminotransferase
MQCSSSRLKDTVGHTSNLFTTTMAEDFAEQLLEACKKTGFDAHNVYFGNSGTEANEAALKFARAIGNSTHNDETGKRKSKVISFKGGFHGRTFGSLSATHNPKYQRPFEPLVPDFLCANFNDLESVKAVRREPEG